MAIGVASACNLDTSGLGGGDTATPVDPSSTGTGTGTGTDTGAEATTGIVGSTSGTTGPIDGTTVASSTGDPPVTDGSTTSSADTADTDTPSMVELCARPNLTIPDAPFAGVVSMIDVPDDGTIVELRVVVRADHSFVGDLTVELSKGAVVRTVIDRPGAGSPHCSGNDIDIVLRDDVADTIDAVCLDDLEGPPPALSGEVQPDEPLAGFVGQPTMGSWELLVTDNATMDDGRLTQWCLQIGYQ